MSIAIGAVYSLQFDSRKVSK